MERRCRSHTCPVPLCSARVCSVPGDGRQPETWTTTPVAVGTLPVLSGTLTSGHMSLYMSPTPGELPRPDSIPAVPLEVRDFTFRTFLCFLLRSTRDVVCRPSPGRVETWQANRCLAFRGDFEVRKLPGFCPLAWLVLLCQNYLKPLLRTCVLR